MTADAGRTAGRVRALGIDVGSTTVKIVEWTHGETWPGTSWSRQTRAWKIRLPGL